MNSIENISSLIKSAFSASAENAAKLRDSESLTDQLTRAIVTIAEAYTNGGCLFVCGNGGSAADSQHLVAELVSKLDRDRTPIRAFALTVDTSILTAIGNDYGYEESFARQVRGLMTKNDILLSITTSGNSPNILKAMSDCRKLGAKNILLSGRDGGPAKELAEIAIIAPGKHTAAIQESHIMIYHTLCAGLEKSLIEKGICRYL